jgi:hypothetical protein
LSFGGFGRSCTFKSEGAQLVDVRGVETMSCCERSFDETWMAIELAQLLLRTESVAVVRGTLGAMGVPTDTWDFSYYALPRSQR